MWIFSQTFIEIFGGANAKLMPPIYEANISSNLTLQMKCCAIFDSEKVSFHEIRKGFKAISAHKSYFLGISDNKFK